MVPWISLFSFWVVEVAIKNRDWLVLGWCAAVGLNVEACAIQLGVGVSRSGAEKDKFEIVVEVKLLFAKLRGCGTGLQKPSGGWVVVQRQKNFNYKLRCREFIKRSPIQYKTRGDLRTNSQCGIAVSVSAGVRRLRRRLWREFWRPLASFLALLLVLGAELMPGAPGPPATLLVAAFRE
jgi:hypothetical protein